MQVYIRLMMFLYLFICICLLIFNIYYILWLKLIAKRRQKTTAFWKEQIDRQLRLLEEGSAIAESHKRLLVTKLVHTEVLIAYHSALEPMLAEESVQQYLREAAREWRQLAVLYSKKDVTERAYFAYVLSAYGSALQGEQEMLSSILLGYFPNSSIYCRENVLQALYAIGSESGVERAFDWMYQHRVSHPARLLSDGLVTFSGDRISLANKLWKDCEKWGEQYQTAVIQMATQFSDSFSELFSKALLEGAVGQEAAFAILRYFRKYPYEPVREYLYQLVLEESELAIAAASALEAYPGEQTNAVLLKGLCSRNWYTRRNAAGSLVALGITEEEILQIDDRYAKEMIQYMAALKRVKGGAGVA